MKNCKDCGKIKSYKGNYCKSCGYKHRVLPKENSSYFKKGEHAAPRTEFKKGQPSAFKGKHFTEEQKNKISLNNKGRIAWNKGKKGIQEAWNKGLKMPNMSGENHPNWQGGVTPLRKKISNTPEYKKWREKILIKDNYRCHICYSKENLEAHHVDPVARSPERVIDENIGVTLCRSCHNFTLKGNPKTKKKKTLLITGGGGFLGSHLRTLLKEKNYRLVAPSSKEFDLVDRDQVVSMIKQYKPDIIISLAAVVGGIGFNQKYPADLFYKNAMIGLNLIHFSIIFGIEKFVQIGTICSYPKFTPIPFKEKDLWSGRPEDTNLPYGEAKKMSLVHLQAARQQYNFNGIYLMPVNLYGPGDNFREDSSHVIPALIKKFIDAKRQNSPEVMIWGTGTPTREFLYVEDAARAIVLAVEKYNGADPVNLGSGNEISIKDLATLIGSEVGYKGNIVFDPTKPDGQPRRRLDVSKAKELFDFEAQTDFGEGLRKTIAWYTGGGEK